MSRYQCRGCIELSVRVNVMFFFWRSGQLILWRGAAWFVVRYFASFAFWNFNTIDLTISITKEY